MKKYFSLCIALGFAGAIQAQQTTPGDALRYTDKDLGGSARFKAMSGAFGAVGGDLSAINVNPAGNAIFSYNSAAFSFGFNNKNNKALYKGNETSERYNAIDIGQMGTTFVFNSRNPESAMKKFVIGINYENTKNFNNDLYIAGTNPNSSISDYFVSAANFGNKGTAFTENDLSVHANETLSDAYAYLGSFYGIDAQQAFLGYQAHVINPNDDGDGYVSNMGTGPYNQKNYITSSGFNGKLTGNFATQLGDRFYVGANLNLHFTDNTRYSAVSEVAAQPTTGEVSSLLFENEIYTYGSGFSFNIGAIAKVTDEMRLGLAYESPTWFRLTDELTQSLSSNVQAGDNYYIRPNVINIYNKYTVQTPASYTGSFAYIFGKSGLISVDYTLKDYSNTKLKPTDSFSYVNNILSNELTTSSEVRIGAEYRIKQLSLRGGYRFEQSPYKHHKTVGDLNSFSAGLGYDFGPSRLDLAYNHHARSYDQALISSGMQDAARIKTRENGVTLTYNISF